MRIVKRTILLSIIFLALIPISVNLVGESLSAPPDSFDLGGDIDEFFNAGAQGYLYWQYSGRKPDSYFANDQYSFFQGDDPTGICDTLKSKAGEWGPQGKFIGVNMWDLGSHDGGKIRSHLEWLNQNCGVTVVRTFAKAGGASGMRSVLDVASGTGVRIIIAIGDYSNGGGGIPRAADKAWYESGYETSYKPLAQNVKDATAGHGSLFGYELANEPHCGGDASALEAYKGWGNDIGGILRGGSGNVGYGQKSSENTTRCDSPTPGDFPDSNSIGEISMTSAHYYNSAEKALSLEALGQSQSLGKMFYIGEASWGGGGPSIPGGPGYIANACEGPLDFEQVGYRGEVIGTDGSLEEPWQLRGSISKRGDANETGEIGGIFKITPYDYKHDDLYSIVSEEVGSADPASERNITKLVKEFRPPTFLRYVIPETIIPEWRFEVPPQKATPESGESYEELATRRFPGPVEERGIQSTTIQGKFLGCFQEEGGNLGQKFFIDGEIELIEPSDIHGIEIWALDAKRNLVSLPCTPGNCDTSFRFTPSYAEMSQSLAVVETDGQETQSEKSFSPFNPNQALAGLCEGNTPVVETRVWTDEATSSDGTFTTGYQACTVSGGECNLRDIRININGAAIGPIGTSTSFPGQCWGAGDGGLPGFGAQNIALNPFTITSCITGGREGDVRNGCHDEACFPQTQCHSCTLSAEWDNTVGAFVPKSNCGLAPPSPPVPVNCYDCSTWAPSRYCPPIEANELKPVGECEKGDCSSQDKTETVSLGCIEQCGVNPVCWFNCTFGKDYVFMLSPASDFIADLNKYRTEDMEVYDAISLIPGVTDEIFEPEPSKAPVAMQLEIQNAKNLTIQGSPVRTMNIEYTNHILQARKFCITQQMLSTPGNIPVTQETKDLCDRLGFGMASSNGTGTPTGPGNQGETTGGGGFTGSLMQGNFSDPSASAIVAAYNGSGNARSVDLVDALHSNWFWDSLQDSPDNLRSAGVSQIINWIKGNYAAGKGSVLQIDWIENSNALDHKAGVPDFAVGDTYDPVIYNGDRLPNYSNPALRQQVKFLITELKGALELGLTDAEYQSLETVQITNERRPSHPDTRAGYDQKWGDAYGPEWISWNAFLADTYRQAFFDKKLLANIAGGTAGATQQLVNVFTSKGIGLKISSLMPDFTPRRARPATDNDPIDALRNHMASTLTTGEHGNTNAQNIGGGALLPSFSDKSQHPPRVFYWDVRAALSFGADQIYELAPSMIDPNSQVVRASVAFFKEYRTKTAATTPKVWIYLKGSEWAEEHWAWCGTDCLHSENFGWFMAQDSQAENAETQPVFNPWRTDSIADIYNKYYRKTVNGGRMYFKMHDGFAGRSSDFAVMVRYKDIGTDSFDVKYSSGQGTIQSAGEVAKTNTNTWKEHTFDLNGLQHNGANGNDFYIDSLGNGEEYVGYVEVTLTPGGSSSLYTPD